MSEGITPIADVGDVVASNRQGCVWGATFLVGVPMTFLTGDVAVMRQTASAALLHAPGFFSTTLAGSPHVVGSIAKLTMWQCRLHHLFEQPQM